MFPEALLQLEQILTVFEAAADVGEPHRGKDVEVEVGLECAVVGLVRPADGTEPR